MNNVLAVEIQGGSVLRVGGVDYRVVFPFAVSMELGNKLGRPMNQPIDFIRMKLEEVRDILVAGLKTAQPNEAWAIADSVLLNTEHEEIGNIIDFLCAAAFPKAMKRILEEFKKAGEEPPKNVQSGAAS